MRLLKTLAPFVLAAPLAAQTTRATAVILGTVADTGLRAIGGANVSFAGTSLRVSADSSGRFQIVHVPAGRFVMIARNIGYRPTTSLVDVRDGDTLRLAFTLEPTTAQELATVVVTERQLSMKLREFEDRRKLGFGEFFTTADLEKMNAVGISDVLRRTKSVRIRNDTAHSAREVGPCPLAIYIDGIPIGSEKLDYLPSPNEMAAVEVYSGANVPVWVPKPPVSISAPRARTGARNTGSSGASIDSDRTSAQLGCGAILFWTKDGSS
jgi:hypothetical protein